MPDQPTSYDYRKIQDKIKEKAEVAEKEQKSKQAKILELLVRNVFALEYEIIEDLGTNKIKEALKTLIGEEKIRIIVYRNKKYYILTNSDEKSIIPQIDKQIDAMRFKLDEAKRAKNKEIHEVRKAQIIKVLSEFSGLSAVEIGIKANLGEGVVNEILRELEQEGIVFKEGVGKNKSFLWSLTKKGSLAELKSRTEAEN